MTGRPAEPASGEDQPTLVAIAVDGKTLRGATDQHGNQVHLLAAATHAQRLVLAQTDVSAKTNEIPMLPVVLDKLELTGVVITADALHTRRDTAKWIKQRGGEFIFPVKNNQPNLFTALNALPWSQIPPHTTIDLGHGRVDRRTIRVLPWSDDVLERCCRRCGGLRLSSAAHRIATDEPRTRRICRWGGLEVNPAQRNEPHTVATLTSSSFQVHGGTMNTTDRPANVPQTVLVVGATGRTGRHVVAGLLGHGVHVRALVRSPLTASLPREVEVIQGDLDDPVSVSKSAEGADAAFLLWHRFSAEGGEAAVTALAEHVRHIVYLSAANLGDGRGDGPVEGVWADIEAFVEQSHVTHTFIRGGGFASNTLEWADQIRRGDTVRIPFPQAARSVVDERDVAEVSVRALLDPDLVGAAITVTGPKTLTQLAQVDAIGAALGRTLVVEEQSVEDARREYAAAMGTSFADAAVSHWESLVDRPEPPRDDVGKILGRPAHTFAAWAAYHADDFRMLSVADVAKRYAAGFRTYDIAAAKQMLAPDVVRVAPLETNGEQVEVRGLAEVMANAELQTANVETNAVDVGDPLIGPTSFAIRFSFDETRRDTGQRQTTTKMSLYTVTASRISREEVFYFTPAHT